MRDSPSLSIVAVLQGSGAQIKAFDPAGMKEAKKLLPDIAYCDDAYGAIEGADAIVIVTEWNEFRVLDLPRVRKLMRAPLIIDLRNIYNPVEMAAAGFDYHSIGRVSLAPAQRKDAL
jgi:UDPglucose 6-dehydrogenase